ncbi:MAG: DUF2330 domain-containing protein [Candidatus Thermoplasmatota archaeon]
MIPKKSLAMLYLIFALLSFTLPAHCDKGIVPTKPNINILEPSQKAIVCWNGSQEILILSTDIQTSENTLAMEILPLPSIPVIEPVTNDVFFNIKKLVENHTRYVAKGETSDYGVEKPSISVIFQTTIGVHNITVIEANDELQFANFVKEELSKQNITNRTYPELENVALTYIEENITYFVIDFVNLSGKRSIEPLRYTFNTTNLYYPLRITSLVPGYTEIMLFVITNYDVIETKKETITIGPVTFVKRYEVRNALAHEKLKALRFYRTYYVATIDAEELKEVDERIHAFFEQEENVSVAVYQYWYGSTKFKSDIIAGYSSENVLLDERRTFDSSLVWISVGIITFIIFIYLFLILFFGRKEKRLT